MRARILAIVMVGGFVAASGCDDTEQPFPYSPTVDAGADVIDAARVQPDAYVPLPIDEDCNKWPRVEGFTPTFKTPAPFHQKKCTDAQVDALLCLFDSNADQTACQKLVDDPANDDCFKCIYTPSSGKELGPVIITGSLGSLNIAGCVARAEGNVTDQSCGAKVQAADQCQDEACDVSMPCPQGDDTALDERNSCQEEAAKTVCAPFAAAAACADALLAPGGAAHACAVGATFVDRAKAIAKLFCSGSTDGGSEASVDAIADAPADVSDDGG